MSVWERDSLFGNARKPGFPRQGHRGAGFSTGPPTGVAGGSRAGFSLEFAVLEAFQRSCDRWVPSQRRTTKPGERDFPVRVTREREFRKRVSVVRSGICSSEIPPLKERDFRPSPLSVAGERNFPYAFGNSPCQGAGFLRRVTGERDFSPVAGERGFCQVAGSGFFSLDSRFQESSLAFQRSCGSLGPFTEKDDEAQGAGFPRSGIFGSGFSIWERDSLFRNSPLAGERASPARVTGGRDFRPGPPPGSLESGIFPCQGRGKRRFQTLPLPFKEAVDRWIPSQRRTTKPGERDSPRQGHQSGSFGSGLE